MSESRQPQPAITAVKGDITRETVDAIVNAANRYLAGGGGVDGAIHRAAGAAGLHAACAELGGCETGDAKVTPGYSLAASFLIHTVGPVWSGGNRGESGFLASCYRRCLEVADEIGARSLAFPAISTGAFGFPAELAAEIAVATLRSTPTDVQLVRLVAFDDVTLSLYSRQLPMP
ncbi:MAG TPA: O-acetyl-ADP-ribose deacetylase [Acidimicrobiales bacterium]|nr:O-acetyl-ADP-ribose deacetylase [Acidimicrobiales bacterium]